MGPYWRRGLSGWKESSGRRKIWGVLESIKGEKVLGLDEFNVKFIRALWGVHDNFLRFF